MMRFVVDRIRKALAHPLTLHLALDDPQTTYQRRRIIHEKSFLYQIYLTWYRLLVAHLPSGHGSVVEIGSGAGFLKDVFPKAIASEVFHIGWIDLVCDAMSMPFRSNSLKALLLVDSLHHIPDPIRFFNDAGRCVRSGGRCLMIEPWNTPWSRFIYQYIHYEPFDVNGRWQIPISGPLSGANGALPWILFERDRTAFECRFPFWRISSIHVMMPFAYLLSGGLSCHMGLPGRWYPGVRRIEKLFERTGRTGMFSLIRLDRVE